MIFEVSVNGEYILSSDQESNLSDFLRTYYDIIVDETEERFGAEIAKSVAKKLFMEDYTIELDSDGETNYTTVIL